ncbi:molybdenum ABC transporter ATP-binding protein [uncultured Propionivibrio sp.]|uniref:molybdenum ABC transporter ATP-binding protein n=1 Tax=uncultured Propionivibrio sp. TaxID=426737 RepID=UPI0029C01FDA|nr:molybdenum ABC transporter ATP-binding protein [uncultured Propionivibrio sp.]
MSLDVRLQLDYAGFALDLDLALPGRGVTALFGHSGSGKTTCLRAIAGLEPAVRGRVVINDDCWQDDAQNIFTPTHRRPLGYVFQDAALFPHLSVRDNLDYGRRRIAASERQISAETIIELLGIGGLLDRRPARLSGGEKSRVAMARALLTRPRLLLMDEPLAALDHDRKQEILPYLERLHDELEIPILYVSHAPDEVARLADHLVVMDAGKALAAGPLGETLARIDLPIRLGEDTGVVIDAVIDARDDPWQLARAAFPGGHLWARDGGHARGQRVRVRVLARDVSIAHDAPTHTSIQNALPATVVALGDDTHPALTLVRLDVGQTPLIARLTRRSAHQLGLCPGMTVWALVKAVALIG